MSQIATKYKRYNGTEWVELTFTPSSHTHTKSQITDFAHTHYSSDIVPLQTKVFEHIWSTSKSTADAKTYTASGTTGGSTDARDYQIYLGKIKQTTSDYRDCWSIKLKITAICETNVNYRTEHLIEIHGAGSTIVYNNFNNYYSSSYRNIYYTILNRLTETGFNAGLEHLFGFTFNSTNIANSNNSNYKRKLTVEILETFNCEFTFLEDWVSMRNYTPATNSTNYYYYINSSNQVAGSITNMNAVEYGLQETGDANNYYQILSYFRPTAGGIGIKGCSLIAQLTDGTYSSFTSTNAQCTSSTSSQNSVNTTDEFVLNSPIWYYSNNSVLNAGSKAGGDYVYKIYHAIDVRYLSNYYGTSSTSNPTLAFNISGTNYSNAYIKITPDFSKGTFKIASLILNETDMKTSGAGYYIFIGRTYSTSYYQITLDGQNPIMYWDGTKFIDINTKHNNESYLGVNDKASDSSKLNGQEASYYLNYNNLSNKPTIPSLSGYATETWVNQQGFLKSHQSLSNYYTKSEVDTEIATAITNVLNTEV